MLTAIVPTEPLNLTLVTRNDSAVRFEWDKPRDTGGVPLLGYKVYAAQGNETYKEVTGAVSSTDPTQEHHEHTASNLVAGVKYKFRVSAVNVIGEGPVAQLRTGQVLEGSVVDYVLAADLPEAPVNPPTINNITQTSITLTLAPVPDNSDGGSNVTGYLVQIDDGLAPKNASAFNYRLVHDSMETNLIIIDGLVGGRNYKIRYAARNLVYDSGNMFACDYLKWSAPVSVLTAVVPNAPRNLRHGRLNDGALLRYRDKIFLQWD